MDGIYGIDLNPLAVITARASIVVFLSPYLDAANPIKIPVYLADAINPAKLRRNYYEHSLQTEFGTKFFKIPKKLIKNYDFFRIFSRIRDLVNANLSPSSIIRSIENDFNIDDILSNKDDYDALNETLSSLVDLHKNGWDGIWCYILADRFAAASIPKVSYIAGNPPWVKWSNLPSEYADFIKPYCIELGLFSDDKWVGGIESDISTVVTYKVIEKWLESKGIMGFLITGTVFATESSQGFRKFNFPHNNVHLKVIEVEDFKSIAPFENATNHPTLLVLKRDEKTIYPLPYKYWEKKVGKKKAKTVYANASDFYSKSISNTLYAAPVPGTDAGPWLRGEKTDHKFWKKLFGGSKQYYKARKGITTDLNGVYFVEILQVLKGNRLKIRNNPSAGRKPGIQQVTATIESKHVFPLLRGRGVKAFSAKVDNNYHVIIPQRGMHGDPELPIDAPLTHKFLRNFKHFLEERSSYKRYQKKQPFWSVWSTGKYTFSKYKVLWKEMSGKNFSAAYVGLSDSDIMSGKVIVPDHKLYFVPLDSEDEAAFLTGFLNAPTVVKGIVSYSENLLSLGISVVEYLNIPKFDPYNKTHKSIAKISINAKNNVGDLSDHLKELNSEVKTLFK